MMPPASVLAGIPLIGQDPNASGGPGQGQSSCGDQLRGQTWSPYSYPIRPPRPDHPPRQGSTWERGLLPCRQNWQPRYGSESTWKWGSCSRGTARHFGGRRQSPEIGCGLKSMAPLLQLLRNQQERHAGATCAYRTTHTVRQVAAGHEVGGLVRGH